MMRCFGASCSLATSFRTTSGTFSPSLQVGIALALVDPDAAPEFGAEAEVQARGRRLRCVVVKPPFVQVKTRQ